MVNASELGKRAGLTVVEVLISVAVLGIVVAAFSSLQVGGLGIARASRVESDALQIAITEIEGFKNRVKEFDRFAEVVNCGALGSGGCEERSLRDGYSVLLEVAGYGVDLNQNRVERGVLTVRATIASDRMPRPVVLTQFVSCLDTVPSPRVDPDNRGACGL